MVGIGCRFVSRSSTCKRCMHYIAIHTLYSDIYIIYQLRRFVSRSSTYKRCVHYIDTHISPLISVYSQLRRCRGPPPDHTKRHTHKQKRNARARAHTHTHTAHTHFLDARESEPPCIRVLYPSPLSESCIRVQYPSPLSTSCIRVRPATSVLIFNPAIAAAAPPPPTPT